MKKMIILLLICFIQSQCSAQTRLVPGELKGKHDTFIVHKLDEPFDTIKHIVVYSKSNKYNKGIPYPKVKHLLPLNPNSDIHVDNAAIRQIVYKVLNKKINALKDNREVMTYILYFKHDGQISDIGFGLPDNTLITLQDIEEIDKRLRATIKATFTGRAYLQYEVDNYNTAPPIVF